MARELSENPFGGRERLGIIENEATALCWCGDVDCLTHADDPAAIEAERVHMDTAGVVLAARMCLDAWDVSETVPPRIHRALAELSDALAKLDKLPF